MLQSGSLVARLVLKLQDVAERIVREAKRRHFAPRVMAADAYPVIGLPAERLAVFVASTTGQARTTPACEVVPSLLPAESLSHTLTTASMLISSVFSAALCKQGELPDNLKQFWRFLLRKSLPASSLAGLTYAVFGLGDSGARAQP